VESKKVGEGGGGTESGGGTFQLFYINIKKESGEGGGWLQLPPFLFLPPLPPFYLYTQIPLLPVINKWGRGGHLSYPNLKRRTNVEKRERDASGAVQWE